MITSKKKLKAILAYEKALYSNYMFPTLKRRFFAWLKKEPVYQIWNWQKVSRYCDYYRYLAKHQGGLYSKVLYLFYSNKRNHMAEHLGIEIITENISKGLLLYHFSGTVINGNVSIGENCHLHGNNCIGNAGNGHFECPKIGNNVMIGVGAKVIGNIIIADNIKIAAGAVVVDSFLEEGITIGGIPARKIK